MHEEIDAQAEMLAEFVRNDFRRPDYEKGLDPWPESSTQRARARRKNGPVRLTLRLPRHVYDQVVRAASRDGMSLNTFFVGSIARAVGEELGYRRDGA